jgi:hypothetical protein
MYKLVNNKDGSLACAIKEGKLAIPADPANTDYQAYLAWLAEGNTPEPADQPE